MIVSARMHLKSSLLSNFITAHITCLTNVQLNKKTEATEPKPSATGVSSRCVVLGGGLREEELQGDSWPRMPSAHRHRGIRQD